jgi:hypothetical protein
LGRINLDRKEAIESGGARGWFAGPASRSKPQRDTRLLHRAWERNDRVGSEMLSVKVDLLAGPERAK